jgi:3',5'-cyclic-AMP phosphodiesterase
LLSGNHDDREVLCDYFGDYEYIQRCEKFIQYTADLGEISLVVIDISSSGVSEGALWSERLAWQDKTLTKNEHRSFVVAMHHPPFKTFIQCMDAIGLNTGCEKFVEIIKKFPNIERIIGGHLHRSIEARIGSTIVCVAPSPAYQVALNLD